MEMYGKQHGEVIAHRAVAQEVTKPTDTKKSAARTIVAGEFVRAAEWVTAAKQQIDLDRRDRVRRVIQRHLRSPILKPAILCRLVGMSRSSLYRLLGDTSGVTRYIQIQRLLEARALLGDPSTNKPIAAIAEELCFADASSFARAFKREFGRSPSGTRLEARARGAQSSMASKEAVLHLDNPGLPSRDSIDMPPLGRWDSFDRCKSFGLPSIDAAVS
jgi:AraC-like DNA-binding protein